MTEEAAPRNKLHDTLAATIVRVQEAMRPLNKEHRDAHITEYLEGFEGELAAAMAPALQPWIDHPDTPEDARAMFKTLVDPAHQFGSSILFAVVGSVFYPLVSGAMTGPAQAITQESLRRYTNTPLSPAELADGLLRHNPNLPAPYAEAAKSGIDRQRLDALTYNAGNALAPGDLLSLWRRNKIGDARLEAGVHQDRLRDEWLPELKMLAIQPPSQAAALEGVLKGRISEARGQRLYEEAGGDPANWEWQLETSGRPYGIEQALHLWNRKKIGEPRVRDVIAHSDINNLYTDDVLELRWYIPPVRSVVAMHNRGAIDDAKATELLKENGVRDADIAGYLSEGTKTRKDTVKELTQAQVVRLHTNGLLSDADAHARLVALGYHDADATLLLEHSTDARVERYKNAIITKAHTLYVAHKITATEAHTALASDGIDGATIAELLRLWDIERATNVHEPTVAQVLHAYRQKAISAAETKARLLALGVQQSDLHIVVTNAYPPTHYEAAAVAAVVNA